MEKKSILVAKNSWKPFIDESIGARKAKDFRRITVKKILHIIDPDVSIWPGSVWRYFLGQIIGPGFLLGRKLLFYLPCQKFLQKNRFIFEKAPRKAIQEWNALMCFLFDKTTASSLLLEEQNAREMQDAIKTLLTEKEKAEKTCEHWAFYLKDVSEKVRKQPLSIPFIETYLTTFGKTSSSTIFSAYTPLSKDTQQKIQTIFSVKDSQNQLYGTDLAHPTPHDRSIIKLIEQATTEFKQHASQLHEYLSSTPYNYFTDLLPINPVSSHICFQPTFLKTLFLQKDLDAAKKMISSYVIEQLLPLSSMEEKARYRAQRLQAIEQEQKRLLELISPFSTIDYLIPKVHQIEEQITSALIPKDIYAKKTTPEIDALYAHTENSLKIIGQSIYAAFGESLREQYARVEQIDQQTTMFLFYLLPLINATTPYPDLNTKAIFLTKPFLKNIAEIRQKGIEGKISIDACTYAMTQATLHPDIRLFFGEIDARAFKLKNLLLPVTNELKTLNQILFAYFLNAPTKMEPPTARTSNFAKIAQIHSILFSFFQKLKKPFFLFKEALHTESVSLLFRYWWQDFSRIQQKIKEINRHPIHPLSDEVDIQQSLTKTVDTVEMISKKRYDSLRKAILSISKNDTLFTIVEKINAVPQEQSIDFFLPLTTIPTQANIPIIKKLFMLEERKNRDTMVAKAIIAITAKQSTRLESAISVLPLLKIFHFMEPFAKGSMDTPDASGFEKQCTLIEEGLAHLEEALLIEIGSLHKMVRFEEGPSNTTILPQLLKIIPELLHTNIELLQHLREPLTKGSILRNISKTSYETQNLYTASLAYFLEDQAKKYQETFESIEHSKEKIFPFIQKIALLRLYTRCIQKANQNNSYCSILLLPCAMTLLLNHFKKTILTHDLEPFAKLETALYEVPAPEDASIFPNSMAKAIDEGISRHNLMPPQIESVCSFAKGSLESASLLSRMEGLLISPLDIINPFLCPYETIFHQSTLFIQTANELILKHNLSQSHENSLLLGIENTKNILEKYRGQQKSFAKDVHDLNDVIYVPGNIAFFLKDPATGE